MFRTNTAHQQTSLLGVHQLLPNSRRRKLENSREALFYELIFKNIPEGIFAVLYSEEGSRPNSPVNRHVGAEILRESKGWTYEELFDHVDFDLKTRYALGMEDIGEKAFCSATHFYFLERLVKHERETGENLMEAVFDRLTQHQLEQLQLKTGIQRMDSFQAMSNIRHYTRLRLVIEVLQRFWRVLSEKERKPWADRVAEYIEAESGRILYRMSSEDYEKALQELGLIYRDLHEAFEESYAEAEVFKIFERVYYEQFAIVKEQVKVRDDQDIDSGSLQSPDDPEATYRHKQGNDYTGQAVHVMETCDPENDLQLVDDVFVEANNIDDSEALNERLKEQSEKYDGVEELHVDGGYPSEDNDTLLKTMKIDMVQTGIRGRPPGVRMIMTCLGEETYEVSCPQQTVISTPTRSRHKAVFDSLICEECSLKSVCPTLCQKQGAVYYFSEADVLRNERLRRLEALPKKRQTLRPNVEATVKEFYKPLNHKGKLRVRGRFKTELFAVCGAIGINLGRIHRYLVKKGTGEGILTTLKQEMNRIPTMSRVLAGLLSIFTKNLSKNRKWSYTG